MISTPKPAIASTNTQTHTKELDNTQCTDGLNGLKLKTEKSNILYSD